jgi:hypothetical protein
LSKSPAYPREYYRYLYKWVLAQCRRDGIPQEKAIARCAEQFGDPIDDVKIAFEDGRTMDPTIEHADDDTDRQVFRAVRALLAAGRPQQETAAKVAKRFGITPATAGEHYGHWRRFDPEPLDVAEI